MTLNASGNVGIGTASPSSKLDVVGTIRATGQTAPTSGAGLEIDYTTADGGRLLSYDRTASLYKAFTFQGSLANFQIGNVANQGLFINTSGNVGIGTTTPTRRLHIVSSDDTRGIMVEQTAASSYAEVHFKANREYRIGTGGSTSAAEAANNWYVYDSTAALQRFVITSAGNVGIGRTPTTNILEINGNASKTTAGDWLANSDSTIKTEIHTIDGALDRINKVRLVSFKYKDEYKLLNPSIKDKFYQNVIAQEYQEIYPDYVYQSGDIFEDKNILQVDTNPMYIDAVASIQQLSAQIDILKQEIINLKTN
jgi:hypothetical protein